MMFTFTFTIFLKRFGFVLEKRSPGSLAVEWHLGPQASLCSPHSETWRNTPNKAPVLFPTHHTLPLVNFETFSQILWRIFCWRSETSIPATSPPSLLHIGLKTEDLRDADKKRIIHPAWCTILQPRLRSKSCAESGKKGWKLPTMHNERWAVHNTVEAEASLSLAALWYP